MIEVKNLCFTYTPDGPFAHTALENVSFSISKGDFAGIIGHTGSGKSTLIQLISGLLKSNSGSIIIDGTDICKKDAPVREIRKKIGIVFQYPEHQLFEETVEDDIAFGPRNKGFDEKTVKECVLDALSSVGLSEAILKKSPFELSGGQKRRVAIAGVLAMRPEILILDEPTAGLDPKGREEILSQIKNLHKRDNITVLFVSHSMEDIAKYTNTVIVLNNSKVFMQGTPAEVFERHEELLKIGLNVPQITKLIMGLRAHGINIRPDIYTVDFAKDEISDLINREGAR